MRLTRGRRSSAPQIPREAGFGRSSPARLAGVATGFRRGLPPGARLRSLDRDGPPVGAGSPADPATPVRSSSNEMSRTVEVLCPIKLGRDANAWLCSRRSPSAPMAYERGAEPARGVATEVEPGGRGPRATGRSERPSGRETRLLRPHVKFSAQSSWAATPVPGCARTATTSPSFFRAFSRHRAGDRESCMRKDTPMPWLDELEIDNRRFPSARGAAHARARDASAPVRAGA